MGDEPVEPLLICVRELFTRDHAGRAGGGEPAVESGQRKSPFIEAIQVVLEEVFEQIAAEVDTELIVGGSSPFDDEVPDGFGVGLDELADRDQCA
ncbi:MAG: hypothetical protein AAF797_07375 [Planctomycetota bacterium]